MAARKKKPAPTRTKAKEKSALNGNGHGNGHAAPVDAKPRQLPISEPLLSSLLPPPPQRRITFEPSAAEQFITVAREFGYGIDADPRLDVDIATLRGHVAHRTTAPRAVLVRAGDSRTISLIVEVGATVGQVHHLSLVPIAEYILSRRGVLDADPRPAPDRFLNVPATTSRVLQLLDGLPEDEVTSHLSNVELFRETVAELVTVDAVGYALGSGSTSLWVRHNGLLWNCCRQSNSPFRVPQPEVIDPRQLVTDYNHKRIKSGAYV